MYKVYEIKKRIFDDNDQEAQKLREELKKDRTFLINLMSSPGSGKTTTLKRIIEALKPEMRIGVMGADIDSAVDADAVSETGVKVIQLHTGGMCHLDADMTRQGLEELGTADVDLAVLENVGNLVCPAEFDTGAVKNVMILSVPKLYADGTLNGIAANGNANADPAMMTVVSVLALVTNVIALAYIIYAAKKKKINPYKNEVFTEFKYYKNAAARAEIPQK